MDALCSRFANESTGAQSSSERRAVHVWFLDFFLLIASDFPLLPDTLQYPTASDLGFSPPGSQERAGKSPRGWLTRSPSRRRRAPARCEQLNL